MKCILLCQCLSRCTFSVRSNAPSLNGEPRYLFSSKPRFCHESISNACAQGRFCRVCTAHVRSKQGGDQNPLTVFILSIIEYFLYCITVTFNYISSVLSFLHFYPTYFEQLSEYCMKARLHFTTSLTLITSVEKHDMMVE